jgi:hypothetical protein
MRVFALVLAVSVLGCKARKEATTEKTSPDGASLTDQGGDSSQPTHVQVSTQGKDGTLAQLLYRAFRDQEDWLDAENDTIGAVHDPVHTGVAHGADKVQCTDMGDQLLACAFDLQAAKSAAGFETGWMGPDSVAHGLFAAINTSLHFGTAPDASDVLLTGNDGASVQCQLDKANGPSYQCTIKIAR